MHAAHVSLLFVVLAGALHVAHLAQGLLRLVGARRTPRLGRCRRKGKRAAAASAFSCLPASTSTSTSTSGSPPPCTYLLLGLLHHSASRHWRALHSSSSFGLWPNRHGYKSCGIGSNLPNTYKEHYEVNESGSARTVTGLFICPLRASQPTVQRLSAVSCTRCTSLLKKTGYQPYLQTGESAALLRLLRLHKGEGNRRSSTRTHNQLSLIHI